MIKAFLVFLASVIVMTSSGCDTGSQGGSESTQTPDTGITDTQKPDTSEDSTSDSTEKKYEGFHVEGTKLLDANGNEFVMRGVNHPHSWYLSQDEVALEAIAEAGCNTVRIVCGSGVQYQKDSVEALRKVIDKCKELEMIAVMEVHCITGRDDIQSLERVTDYWIEVKDAFIGNEEYVILNIANEWVGQWNSNIWRDGYTAAVPKLREAGIKNTIMVDAAGWGQYGKSISDFGTEVLNSDPDRNTMFAVHMYGSAGKNEKTIEQNLYGATSKDLCIIVGEFGHTHSDGDVKEEYIMEYCEENDLGYLGWSWKGNSGGVEYLDIAVNWDGSKLSEDWGEVLINGENGIKATAKICSVFED